MSCIRKPCNSLGFSQNFQNGFSNVGEAVFCVVVGALGIKVFLEGDSAVLDEFL